LFQHRRNIKGNVSFFCCFPIKFYARVLETDAFPQQLKPLFLKFCMNEGGSACGAIARKETGVGVAANPAVVSPAPFVLTL
jgi:hypothetical protein